MSAWLDSNEISPRHLNLWAFPFLLIRSPVANPLVNPEAHIDITTYGTQSEFHSHPSGTRTEGTTGNNTIGGSTTTGSFLHAPSNKGGDVENSGKSTNYVFSRSNGTVYIYNNTGVLATIPQKYFVKPN